MAGRRQRVVIALSLAALCAAASVEAQFGRGRGGFCRIPFRNSINGDGGGWSVDYPRADINLSIRLSELTKTPVSRRPSGEPNNLLVGLTDDVLFDCPFVMMTEPGGAAIEQDEADRLRLYLLKGGFLWVDDFWGSYAWEHWVSQLRKALPAAEFPITELGPDHPLFRTQFEVHKVPQIPSIGHFYDTGGTSERGADSAVARARVIADPSGRIMVLMTHNTDMGDSWEREGDDPTYFLNFGPNGYAFGINTVLYALTH